MKPGVANGGARREAGIYHSFAGTEPLLQSMGFKF